MEATQTPDKMMTRFQQKLEKNVGGSFYGKQVWVGLHSTIEHADPLKKMKVLAEAIFGTYLATFTTYFSIDGAIRITKWSIEERMNGHPLPSDIGHGGEWFQQPFQNLLLLHLYIISTLANEGHMAKVKKMYAKFIQMVPEGDLSEIYSQFEEDVRFLAKRSYRSTNLFEIKLEMIKIFRNVDISLNPCPSLDLDRTLEQEYRSLMEKIQKLDNWNPKNFLENWRIGIYQLGKRGIGQAIEKSAYFTLFQVAMLASSAFLILGLAIVIDEVFISKTGEEASGHLSEWVLNVLTNFFLIRYSYLFLIKREAIFIRTRRVMQRHLDSLEGDKTRLITLMNQTLDHMAEKCHFTHLPSSYRFRLDPVP